MATKNKTAKITDQQQVEERLKIINANIVEVTKLVQSAASLQTKSAKSANDKIQKIMEDINDDFKNVKETAEKSISPNSEIMKKAKQAASVPGVASVLSKMSVLPVPTKLTYLHRFVEFWDKRVEKIVRRLFSGKSKFTVIQDEFNQGDRGYAIKSGKGYVEKDSMNEFMGGLLTQITAGQDPSAAIGAVLSGNPSLREEMGSVITVMQSALGAVQRDQALYTIEAEDISYDRLTQNASFKSTVESLYSASDTLSSANAKKKDIDRATSTIDRSIEKLVKLANKTKSTIDITFTGSSGSLETASFDSTQKAELKTFFEKNNRSVYDISYTDSVSGVVTDASSIDREAVERSKLISKERKINSSKKQVENFLKSIMVTAKPKSKTKGMDNPTFIFNDKEIAGLSGLFFAAYVNLPKFEQDKYKELGLDASVIGSQSLSVARLNLARIMEKIIATKVLNASASGAEISTANAVYKRERKKNMSFGSDPSEIINKILFSISPTEFPTDWTIAFATEQQLKLRVGEKDYRIKSDTFFLDPDLNMNEKRVAQGDHIIAYNQGGATIPRNLLALSSSLNQSKQDADTGLDQILLTLYTQNRLFGENSELDWIQDYEKSQEIIGTGQVASQVSQAEIDLRRSKIKYPSDEIAQFDQDVILLKQMDQSAEKLVALFNQTYNAYISAYSEIQKEYTSISSHVSTAKREVRDIINVGLSGGALHKDSDFKRLIDSTKREIEALKKLLPVGHTDRKIANDIAAKYNGVVKTINNRAKDARENKEEYDERILEIRRISDEFFDEMDKTTLAMRRAQLEALNNLFAQFGSSIGLLTKDLQKGEQAFRGSITAAALTKSDFPTPAKIEETIIYKNKVAYESLINKEWKKAQALYKKIVSKAGGKGADISALASSLGDIEEALRAVMQANEFVLFSEFFE